MLGFIGKVLWQRKLLCGNVGLNLLYFGFAYAMVMLRLAT
jgi:hypothetical protein